MDFRDETYRCVASSSKQIWMGSKIAAQKRGDALSPPGRIRIAYLCFLGVAKQLASSVIQRLGGILVATAVMFPSREELRLFTKICASLPAHGVFARRCPLHSYLVEQISKLPQADHSEKSA
jgi:hypothetical protein